MTEIINADNSWFLSCGTNQATEQTMNWLALMYTLPLRYYEENEWEQISITVIHLNQNW